MWLAQLFFWDPAKAVNWVLVRSWYIVPSFHLIFKSAFHQESCTTSPISVTWMQGAFGFVLMQPWKYILCTNSIIHLLVSSRGTFLPLFATPSLFRPYSRAGPCPGFKVWWSKIHFRKKRFLFFFVLITCLKQFFLGTTKFVREQKIGGHCPRMPLRSPYPSSRWSYRCFEQLPLLFWVRCAFGKFAEQGTYAVRKGVSYILVH